MEDSEKNSRFSMPWDKQNPNKDISGAYTDHASDENSDGVYDEFFLKPHDVARKSLGESEKRAAKDGSSDSSNKDSAQGSSKDVARESENNVASSFKNLVSGKSDKRQGRGKKRGISAAIFAALSVGGFGAVSFLGQAAMPFSLINQFIGNFDSIGVSNFTRTQRFTKWQMHPNSRSVSNEAQKFVKQHSKIYQFATGDSEKYFKITNKQANKLSKHGIEVVDNGAGGQIMRYKTTEGVDLEIVADPNQATGGRVLIDDLYDADMDFRQSYHEGTRTWRQAVADWFDGLSRGFLDKINVIRNRFSGFDADGSNSKNDFEATVKDAVGGDDFTGKTGNKAVADEEIKTEDPDTGETSTTTRTNFDTNDADLKLTRGMKAQEVADSLSSFTNGVGGKVSKVAKEVANGVCTVSEIIGAINLLIMANEAIQILQVASTVFEGIQKSQVVDSKESPVNDIATSLTTRKTTTYGTANGNGETVTTTGSAMEANAVSALYGNTAVNSKDPSVNSFNLTDSLNNVMKAFGNTMTAYKGCLIAKLAGGIIEAGLDALDVATDIASVVACIGGAVATAGASCAGVIGKIVVKVVAAASFSILIGEIAKHVVSYIVPKAATMLGRDLATDIGGEDFGNALVSGANMYMGQNHQYGGGSVATKDTLITYLKQQEVYIADQARYERETRSPFDITSQYTFMGSLFAKSIPILTQTNSVISGINNVATVAGNALSSLMPGASAITAAKTAQAAAENTAATCPELDSIGAVGDAFCNPYFITDLGTMDKDPAEVIYKVSQYDENNFKLTDNEDTPAINTNLKDSKLMKYMVFCGQRSSGFGMADQNIANTINSGAGTIESNIPIWGGIADVFQNGDLLNNVGYISGEACVTRNNSNDMGSAVFTWEEASYYQRYIEDQRLAENEGLIEKSAVTVALESYYEEHPIDASYEGILAARMGVTKEYLAETMDMLEGFMWIADYDPSDLYPYKAVEEEKSEVYMASMDNVDNFISSDYIYPYYYLDQTKKEYYVG